MQDLKFDELEYGTAQKALEWMEADIQQELEDLDMDYTQCGFIFNYLHEQTRFNTDGQPYLESVKLNIHTIAALLLQWEGLTRWNKLIEIISINENIKKHLEKFLFGFSSTDCYGNDFSLDLYSIDQFDIPIHETTLYGEEKLLCLLELCDEPSYEEGSANWIIEPLIGDQKGKECTTFLEFLDWFFNKAVNKYYELLTEKITQVWKQYSIQKQAITSFHHCHELAEGYSYLVDEDGEIIDFFPISEKRIEAVA